MTAMELSVGAAAATVMVAVPLKPLMDAVTVVEPEATALTRPPVLTVATAELAVAQVAVEVTLAVEPSL